MGKRQGQRGQGYVIGSGSVAGEVVVYLLRRIYSRDEKRGEGGGIHGLIWGIVEMDRLQQKGGNSRIMQSTAGVQSLFTE
jgi:hypothetical protein